MQYEYDGATAISTVVITENAIGEIIEVESLKSFESIGVPLFDFFTMQPLLLNPMLITIHPDNTVSMTGVDPLVIESTPFDGNVIPEFGLVIDGDQIIQRGCFELATGPVALGNLQANFCEASNSLDAASESFRSQGFGVADTMAYSIIDFVYRKI